MIDHIQCFATLTERMARKSLDAGALNASANLVERLVSMLVKAARPHDAAAPSTSSADDADAVRTVALGNGSMSVIFNILISLCKSSESASQQLVAGDRERTLEALAATIRYLASDDKCLLDALRLADVVLCLVCEGRAALAEPGGLLLAGSSSPAAPNAAAAGERQLAAQYGQMAIDAIRHKDLEALVDFLDTYKIDVDHQDSIGQTLLNWAASFGSADIVAHLCERGADVNRGARCVLRLFMQ